MEQATFVQDGFVYYREEDAKQSATEVKKMEYMETKMDYSNPDQIHRIYEKAIQEGVFQSMPGICYLNRIRDYLLSQETIDAETVSPIPSGKADRVVSVPVRREKKEEPVEKTKKVSGGFVVSIITNIALVIAVIVMFVIALDSENPNVLNYEEKLQNKYAAWEMKLMEREQAVREKEREYQMEGIAGSEE